MLYSKRLIKYLNELLIDFFSQTKWVETWEGEDDLQCTQRQNGTKLSSKGTWTYEWHGGDVPDMCVLDCGPYNMRSSPTTLFRSTQRSLKSIMSSFNSMRSHTRRRSLNSMRSYIMRRSSYSCQSGRPGPFRPGSNGLRALSGRAKKPG